MDQTIIKALKERYPLQFKNKSSYQISVSDLEQIFGIVADSGIFLPKLDRMSVFFFIEDPIAGKNDKGHFRINSKSLQVEIGIVRNPYGDNFQKVVSVLCHEMIHMYDYLHGEMRKFLNGQRLFKTSTSKSGQLVNGRYIAHGRFFQSYISKFAKYGITVWKAYPENATKFMKDSEVRILDEIVAESDSPGDIERKKELQLVANSIECNDGPAKLIFADKDHWAIEID